MDDLNQKGFFIGIGIALGIIFLTWIKGGSYMDDPNQKGFYIFMGILVGICLLGTLYFLPAYLR